MKGVVSNGTGNGFGNSEFVNSTYGYRQTVNRDETEESNDHI